MIDLKALLEDRAAKIREALDAADDDEADAIYLEVERIEAEIVNAPVTPETIPHKAALAACKVEAQTLSPAEAPQIVAQLAGYILSADAA